MNKKYSIIGVGGKMGSGKTTFATELMNIMEKQNILYEHRYFAEPIKNICKELTGMAGHTQDEKNIHLDDFGVTLGELMQIVGDKLREINPDIFINVLFKNLKEDSVLIISDCRFSREADMIRKYGGIMIKFEGDPLKIRANSKRDFNHQTETSLDNYPNFDYQYMNDKSMEDLRNFAEKILNYIMNQ